MGMYDVYQPRRDEGVLGYDAHVGEIVLLLQIAAATDAELLARLLDGMRGRVHGEMLIEVLERFRAASRSPL